jgi:hypothetical protein
MGYETNMIVVTKHPHQTNKTFLLPVEGQCDKVYYYFEDKTGRFYYPDGNTKIPVPAGAKTKEGIWCQDIAVMDLCKVGDMPGICDFEKSDGCYAYNPFNGNELIGLDPYGSYRSFVPVKEVIAIMEKSNKEEPYRRITAALALLKALKKGFPDNEHSQLGCLFYGH